ncbi:MAG TPA: hypothetical protein G4N96_00150 [Chloroflexi bacterium]|nr:MAG: hypothetical protein B6243_00865 [Anaerolineaceae bacterium 4572_5.2]HEY83511.1 hypothetical protein [Chloroflexota bacterium]
MLFSAITFADVAIGAMLAFGAILLVISFIVVVLLESLALKLLKWNGYWRSLWASFLMNLVSTLVGLPLMLLPISANPVMYLPVTWGLSVIIEGSILILMKRSGGRQNWIAAIIANIASYILLMLLLLVMSL